MIKSSAETLCRVVNDLFDFSRIDPGGVQLEVLEFAVRALIGCVVESFTADARAKCVAFQSVATVVPAMVVGDPARVASIPV
jgi:two-component system, sensor histidine kinase and response regulator